MDAPQPGNRLSLDDLRDLYDARLLLEPEIAARAAKRFTEEDAAVAGAYLDRQDEARARGDVAGAWQADADFHTALYDAARSPWLQHLAHGPFAASRHYLGSLPPDAANRLLGGSRQEHRAILRACVAHDVRGVRSALHDHLAGAANRIAAGMGSSPLFGLRAARTLTEPLALAPADQSFVAVRPGVEGATIETGDLTVTTYRYRPGAIWQEHAHPEDQLTMLLAGDELRFEVGGRDVALHPGELVLIPGGVPHSAVVGGTEVLTLNVWRLRSALPT